MELTREFLEVLQNRLKVGNRRGVHLNSIPGRSRYKFDIERLRSIKETLPEDFITALLTQNPLRFKISWKENVPDLNSLFEEDQTKLIKITKSIDNLINQTEAIESEKGINTFGFGFPQLVRRDKKDNRLTVSPLLIWSLRIKRTQEFNTWLVYRNEDDPIYLNEVLINHLQSDSQVTIPPISEEMLDDGLIDQVELVEICCNIIESINSSVKSDLSTVFTTKIKQVESIKSKKDYEKLPLSSNNSFIEFGGLFSIFEVQKQNIIKDYEHLMELAGSEIEKDDLVDHHFQPLTNIQTDPTQQRILNDLGYKRNIVIQGPPGTGKSQTLTAILINALENHKRTIVVCEKRTALDVLYNTLSEKGLSDLVAPIIDSIKDRHKTVHSVRSRLELLRSQHGGKGNKDTLQKKIDKANGFIVAVNNRHSEVDRTIFDENNWTDSVGLFLKNLRRSENEERIDISSLAYAYTSEELNEKTALLKKGQRLYEAYNTFHDIQFLNFNQLVGNNPLLLERRIREDFKGYKSTLEDIRELNEKFKESYIRKRKGELKEQEEKVALLHNRIFDILYEYKSKPEFLDLRITNSFGYKLKAMFSSGCKKLIADQNNVELTYVELIRMYENCPDYGNPKSRLGFHSIIDHNAQLYEELVQVESEFKKKSIQEFTALDIFNNVSERYHTESYKILRRRVNQLIDKIKSQSWSIEKIKTDTYERFLQSVEDLIAKEEEYFDQDSDPFSNEFAWYAFYNEQSQEDQKMINLIKNKEDWCNSFLISFLDHLLVNNATSDLPTDDFIYTDLDEALSSIGQEQLRYIKQYWSAQQIEKSNAFIERTNLSVENLFQKRNSKNHKKLSLREIAKYDIDLFTTFFPVILTTPDESSKLFSKTDKFFDIVMFDEASQLRIEDNLPALLKGRQVIVAGDEHQMPPSNYFGKMFEGSLDTEDDIEEDEVVIDIENALLSCESLLDFTEELNFDKRYLDFHYRSKHPYLIDFSNHAFYNSRLKPLPITLEYNPIKYVHVNGTYSDTCNEQEAEAVFSILENNINKKPNGKYPSVGIATLNISQRNLIKGKILERRKFEKYETFNEKIIELEKEGLFVKNLENIQGDERDVIILSTTYGINPEGKFNQRYGPLNHAKGYKLLNVIITRAKYKLYVCTSIPEEVFLDYKHYLNTEGSNNRRGVFYAYLAYAKAVSESDELNRINILEVLKENNPANKKVILIDKDLESPFEEEVYEALAKRYDESLLKPQHEYGGFRIDIVYESLNPSVPKIAIECDGAAYHSSHEAYLYDMHRQKILEANGFVFHRIWSTNWFRNAKREEKKLFDFIKKTELEYSDVSRGLDYDQSFSDDLVIAPFKKIASVDLFSDNKNEIHSKVPYQKSTPKLTNEDLVSEVDGGQVNEYNPSELKLKTNNSKESLGEEMVITISQKGGVRKYRFVDFENLNNSAEGVDEAEGLHLDLQKIILVALDTAYILFFTELGKCFWSKVSDIPEFKSNVSATFINDIINIAKEDNVTSYVTVKALNNNEFIKGKYVVFSTQLGKVKKTKLEALCNPHVNGLNAFAVNEGDKLVNAKITDGNCDILLARNDGRVLRFGEQKVDAKNLKSRGLKGIHLNRLKDEVIGMVCPNMIDNSDAAIFVLSEQGYGNRISLDAVRKTIRGGNGVKAMDITSETGELKYVSNLSIGTEVIISTQNGTVKRIPVEELPILRRGTKGQKVINLKKQDIITNVTVMCFKSDQVSLSEEKHILQYSDLDSKSSDDKNNFSQKSVQTKYEERPTVLKKDLVSKQCKVKVLYLNNGKEIVVELADFLPNRVMKNQGVLRIKNDTPLARSIIGKEVGDTVQVGMGDYFVQILEILNS